MAQKKTKDYVMYEGSYGRFYTYGEYGRAINGRHEFHSTTCCWVALQEK
jgi:hypothetical protein